MLKQQYLVKGINACRSLMGRVLRGRGQTGILAFVCLMTVVQSLSAQTFITTNTTDEIFMRVQVIASKKQPLTELDRNVREKLLEHWDEFPLVDNELPAHEDEGEHVIVADGIVCTDKWQRLVMNTDPVIVDGKRYSAFRFKSTGRGGRDIYFGLRKPKTFVQWFITAKSEPIRGFTEYQSLATQPALPDQYAFQKLDKEFVKDKEEYLLVIAFTNDKPHEIAFIYDNMDGHGRLNLNFPGRASIDIPGMAMNGLPLAKASETRRATGIVLADHDAVICGVVPGSPADKAGLKAADRLVKVDHWDTGGLTNKSWRESEIELRNVKFVIQYLSGESKETQTVTLVPTRLKIESIREIRHSYDRLKYSAMYGSMEKKYETAMRILTEPQFAEHKADAVPLLEEAGKAQVKNYFAIVQLGQLYDEGIGVPQDYKKAIEIYEYVASQKVYDTQMAGLKAKYELGRHYDKGLGVDADFEKAALYYAKADRYENGLGNYTLAELYLTDRPPGGPDTQKALEAFRDAHSDGHPEASYRQALLHQQATDDSRDHRARFAFENSAARNHVVGMTQLGKYYELGIEVYQNDATAAKWYQKAWDTGKDPEAAQRLGLLMEQGRGIEKNPEKAKELLDYAKDHGVTEIKNPIVYVKPPRTRN